MSGVRQRPSHQKRPEAKCDDKALAKPSAKASTELAPLSYHVLFQFMLVVMLMILLAVVALVVGAAVYHRSFFEKSSDLPGGGLQVRSAARV